ncbi:MAG: hypothetical protein HKP58_15815 [Desulfatitalea sp.]|nr:hypothetical protein [Desulfatitalea sp.]NNK01878.1 hypothetical protein [Desulfatitalea sp.]
MRPINGKATGSRGRWWKITIGVLLITVIGLTVVAANIDTIVHHFINRSLERFLAKGGTLDAIDIQLKSGRVALDGLTVRPPEGFGKHPVLSLKTAVLDVEPGSFLSDEIVVEQLHLTGLSLVVVRDPSGRLSVLNLTRPDKASAKRQAGNGTKAQGDSSLPAIHVNTLRIEDLSVRLIDQMAGEQWAAGFGVDMAMDNLQLKDLLKRDIATGKCRIVFKDFKVDQPPGFSRHPMLTVKNIVLTTPGIDLGASNFPVNRVILNQLTASIEKNEKGDVNLQRIASLWVSGDADTNQDNDADAQGSKKNTAHATSAFPTLTFEAVRLDAIALQVLNHIDSTPTPWRAGFNELNIDLAGLKIGDIKKRAISLDDFQLDLQGVAVDQPAGFEKATLAAVAHLAVSAGKLDLTAPEMVIHQVLVKAPSATWIVPDDGISNLKQLKLALFGNDEPKSEDNAAPLEEQTAPHSQTRADLPAIRFETIEMEMGAMRYYNAAMEKTPLILTLTNMALAVKQLRLFEKKSDAPPGSAELSFELNQPGHLPTAYFDSFSSMGSLGGGMPLVNTQIRLTGLKLDTLGGLVPPATRTSLGASGFDADLQLALNRRAIHLTAAALSDRGINYEGIKVHGPLDDPEIKLGPIMAGALGRLSGGVFNLSKGALHAGVDIAESSIDTAKEFGSGAWKMTANLGKSILKTSAGLVTLDKDKVEDGFVGTTEGTMAAALNTVKDTGSAVGDGLHDSVSDVKGDKMIRKWDANIPARHEAAIKQAREALRQMPCPPMTD